MPLNGAALDWTPLAPVTATGTSGTLLAAVPAGTNRHVRICVPWATDTGVYLNFGGGAATNRHLLEAGADHMIVCDQAITVIRAGAANAVVYPSTGVTA